MRAGPELGVSARAPAEPVLGPETSSRIQWKRVPAEPVLGPEASSRTDQLSIVDAYRTEIADRMSDCWSHLFREVLNILSTVGHSAVGHWRTRGKWCLVCKTDTLD